MVMGRWLPPFGIAFTVDLTGALFALTAGIVAFAGAVAALDDVNDSGRRYGFYPFLMLLMAGVNGAFLTGDVFNLYVWFEVLLISSFGLLVLGSERGQIDGAVEVRLPQPDGDDAVPDRHRSISTASSARSTWPTSR